MISQLFETKEIYNNSIEIFTNQINALEKSVNLMPELASTLNSVVEEKKELLDYVAKMKSWNFNFESGGWNSVSARTKEEAIETASKEYNDTEQRYHCKENGGGAIPMTKVDPKTFRLATEADTNHLLSMFY